MPFSFNQTCLIPVHLCLYYSLCKLFFSFAPPLPFILRYSLSSGKMYSSFDLSWRVTFPWDRSAILLSSSCSNCDHRSIRFIWELVINAEFQIHLRPTGSHPRRLLQILKFEKHCVRSELLPKAQQHQQHLGAYWKRK